MFYSRIKRLIRELNVLFANKMFNLRIKCFIRELIDLRIKCIRE